MSKYFGLLTLIFLCACTESKPKMDLMRSVAKTQEQIKSEKEVKRERMRIAEIGSNAPIGKLIDKDSIIKTTDDFEGKLLIIDFWATWCSPCLEQTPKFKELEKIYESDKVEFITVSVNDEFSFWKEYITENNWETDNYWFGMKETEPFFSYMYSEMEVDNDSTVLIALPKYVIISPKGKILNNRAAKPSDPEFEKEIVDFIKEFAT